MSAELIADVWLSYHLQYNHYPPVTTQMIPYCREAIQAVADGEFEHVITFPNGETEPAYVLVENLHLDGFVEQLMYDEEMEDDDG